MRIASRFSVLRIVLSFALLLAPAVVASARGAGSPHHSGHQAAEHGPDHGPQNGGGAAAPAPEGNLVENPRAARARRNCVGPNRARRDGRAGRVGDCGDYDEPEFVGSAPAETPASEPAPPAAKIAHPRRQGEVESFSSHVSDDLEEQLVGARKNLLAKQEQLRNANSDWAQAQYEADRAGTAVDSNVLLRQASAQEEADAARAAMGPLVEQARESGMSPQLLDLYMR